VAEGEALIPRGSVTKVRVHEGGWKWRVIGTIAAPVVVLALIAVAAGDLPEPGASGEQAVSAALYGSMAGGYLLGWWLDKRETVIDIVR
jgi:hypothetical protein